MPGGETPRGLLADGGRGSGARAPTPPSTSQCGPQPRSGGSLLKGARSAAPGGRVSGEHTPLRMPSLCHRCPWFLLTSLKARPHTCPSFPLQSSHPPLEYEGTCRQGRPRGTQNQRAGLQPQRRASLTGDRQSRRTSRAHRLDGTRVGSARRGMLVARARWAGGRALCRGVSSYCRYRYWVAWSAEGLTHGAVFHELLCLEGGALGRQCWQPPTPRFTRGSAAACSSSRPAASALNPVTAPRRSLPIGPSQLPRGCALGAPEPTEARREEPQLT